MDLPEPAGADDLRQTPSVVAVGLRRRRDTLWWVVAACLTRWRVEEDIRVLTCERLRNLVALVNAVAYFTAVELGTRIKLGILATHLIKAARRLFGVPDFPLYALADGISAVCARAPRRAPPSEPPDRQLALRLA